MTVSLLTRISLAAATGLLAASSLVTPAAAATGTGVLEGVFTTAAGLPVENVGVSVWLGDGTDVWTHLWTDSTGHFETDLPAGGYLLGFWSDDVSQWSPGQVDKDNAELYTVVEGETITVNEIQL
ncbi:hypothetical protein [Actinoplanes derwentensis]|uniref:Carboxypeptidase regulatory-like domain-containing protein n=1 Tax=Actinoplanes derwentensis TaxID=113562 RepID=A0A1H2CL40_9ACTN|nr:hypothetical protein [Actinoplanes derwentensis]GID82638.1 hypothetical protein Ade03nite_15620 [Actinoplanes derwentensis]SDT70766.1 hypothetical protein SAMN04489716_6017 [Actinoplanes derwentensis]